MKNHWNYYFFDFIYKYPATKPKRKVGIKLEKFGRWYNEKQIDEKIIAFFTEYNFERLSIKIFLKINSSKNGAIINAGTALIKNSKFNSEFIFTMFRGKSFGVVTLLYISKNGSCKIFKPIADKIIGKIKLSLNGIKTFLNLIMVLFFKNFVKKK